MTTRNHEYDTIQEFNVDWKAKCCHKSSKRLSVGQRILCAEVLWPITCYCSYAFWCCCCFFLPGTMQISPTSTICEVVVWRTRRLVTCSVFGAGYKYSYLPCRVLEYSIWYSSRQSIWTVKIKMLDWPSPTVGAVLAVTYIRFVIAKNNKFSIKFWLKCAFDKYCVATNSKWNKYWLISLCTSDDRSSSLIGSLIQEGTVYNNIT